MYNFGELHLHVVFHESMEKPALNNILAFVYVVSCSMARH